MDVSYEACRGFWSVYRRCQPLSSDCLSLHIALFAAFSPPRAWAVVAYAVAPLKPPHRYPVVSTQHSPVLHKPQWAANFITNAAHTFSPFFRQRSSVRPRVTSAPLGGGDPPWFGGTKSRRRAADGLGSWLPTLVPGRPNATFVASLPLSLRGPPKPMRPPIFPPHLHRRTASISSTKAKGSGGVGWRLGLGLCVVEYRHPVFGQGKARMEFPVAAGRFRGIPQMSISQLFLQRTIA